MSYNKVSSLNTTQYKECYSIRTTYVRVQSVHSILISLLRPTCYSDQCVGLGSDLTIRYLLYQWIHCFVIVSLYHYTVKIDTCI